MALPRRRWRWQQSHRGTAFQSVISTHGSSNGHCGICAEYGRITGKLPMPWRRLAQTPRSLQWPVSLNWKSSGWAKRLRYSGSLARRTRRFLIRLMWRVWSSMRLRIPDSVFASFQKKMRCGQTPSTLPVQMRKCHVIPSRSTIGRSRFCPRHQDILAPPKTRTLNEQKRRISPPHQ